MAAKHTSVCDGKDLRVKKLAVPRKLVAPCRVIMVGAGTKHARLSDMSLLYRKAVRDTVQKCSIVLCQVAACAI